MTAPGYGSDDVVTEASVAARRRAQTAAAMAGGVAPGAVLVALARADEVRERYRRGGAGAPTLADVVTAYGRVAPKEG
jgi:hypothetical protein